MCDVDERAVEKAVERLETAEEHQAEAHVLEAKADREVAEAQADLEEALSEGHGRKPDRDEVEVHFTHLGEREKAHFDVRVERSLQSIWDESYQKLEIAKGERDVLQAVHKAGNPTSLMEHLSLSLEEAQRQELCGVRFEIAAATGGA
jgi:uncharacterized membrane protein YqiK